jgi:VCBS repeat-containing protein
MDARITVAQITGSLPNTESPKVVKLTKPQTDQAITIHLDGATKLDLTAIGNDDVTFVHAGDRLVILFDNHSTVTIDPFYDSKGLPQADILVELSADRSVSGVEFASLFPITTDQSILPAAGDGGSPPSGGHFETATVDPLGNSQTPLALLGPDAPTGNGGPTNPPGNVAVGTVLLGPTLGVHDVGGNEDKPIALGITDALSTADPHALLGNLTITGVPAGATLSAGTHNADGSWTLTPAQLAGLTLASNGEVQHFTLAVSGTTTDGAITANAVATLNVDVTPVADQPTLTVGGFGPLTLLSPGQPGQVVNAVAINDAGTIVGTIESSVVVEGFELPAGSSRPILVNFAGAALTTFSGIGPAGEILGGTTKGGGDPFHGFVLNPDGTRTPINFNDPNTTDTQTVGINASGEIVGNAIVNGKGFVGFTDQGGTFSTINIEGRGTTQVTGVDNAGDVVGSFSTDLTHVHGFILAPGATTPTIFDIPSATVTEITGINNSGVFVGAFAGANGALSHGFVDNNGTITTFDLPGSIQTIPTGINDNGQIVGIFSDGRQTSVFETTIPGVGVEDKPIALQITAALSEVDADAVLSVTISNIPAGVTLSAGTHNADGSVTLTPAQLAGLTLTSDGETTNFDLKVTAAVVDGGDTATSASLSETFHVAVTPVADTPTLTAPNTVSGNEGQPIALSISSALPEADRDEALTITIGGIPDGVKLDDANHDRIVITNGSAVLTPSELAGLTLTGDGVAQHFDLSVTASAVDGKSVGIPVTTTLHVDVAPVAVTEDANVGNLSAAGTVSFADVGLTDTHSVSFVPLDPNNTFLGTFAPTLASDGTVSWTFTVADDATDFLAQGQTLTQTYAITVADGHGGAATQKVVIDINGTNEAPVIVAAATTAAGSVTEDTNVDPVTHNLSAAGTVSFTDVDLIDTHSVSVTVPQGSNYLGTFTPTFTTATDATGGKTGTVGWTFTVADDATDSLAQGQTLTQTYTVTVDDGHGGIAKQDVVVTINGSNENPTVNVNEVPVGALNEPTDTPTQDNSVPGVLLATAGTFSFADVDVIDTHSVTGVVDASGGGTNLGTLTASVTQDTINGLNGVVTWNYSVDTAAVESLAQGEVHTDTFRVFLADNQGGPVSKIVKVNITGTNDVPVAHDDVVSSINGSPLTEDSAPISLNSTLATVLKANDILDPDHGALNSVTFGSSVTVAPNDFGITANDVTLTAGLRGGAAPSITLGSKFQTLSDGEFVDVILPYTLKGDQPTDVSTANVTFHVAGINDPPITNDVTVDAASVAAGTPIQVKLTGSDVDGTVASFKINDLPAGTLFTDAAETHAVQAGDLIAATGNAATLFFKADAGGNTTSFHFTAIDNEGLASTAPATATVNVNHPPVAVNDTFSVSEDGALVVPAPGVLANDSDPDAGDTIHITSVNFSQSFGVDLGSPSGLGDFFFNQDGSFQFLPSQDPNSPAQRLNDGQTATFEFVYQIADSHGATSNARVDITIVGHTDVPHAVESEIVNAAGFRTVADWHFTAQGVSPFTFKVTQGLSFPSDWGTFLPFSGNENPDPATGIDPATGNFRLGLGYIGTGDAFTDPHGPLPPTSGPGSTDHIGYSFTDNSGVTVNGQLDLIRIDGSIPFNITGSANGDDLHFLGAAGGMDHLGNGNNFVETGGGLGTVTTVFGGSGNNTFMGGPGAGQNVFHGGSGNDIFTAGFHGDILDGGGGNNQFFVGSTSLASGQVNHAKITGGSDNNTFSLANSDVASSTTITDYHFTPGGAQDTIDLSTLSVLNLGAGAAAFNNALFGTPGSPQPLFDPIANGLNFNDFIKLVDDPNGKDVHLEVDPDGTGTGFQFHDVALLQNHHAADITDFNLAGGSVHIQFHGNNIEITEFGSAGNDTLYSGYSFLPGQSTHETLTGSVGNDTFSFNSTDPLTTATITDYKFVTGGQQDVLDFSHLNTINLGAAFNQALFGTSGFDPTANGKNVSDFVQLVNDANGKDVHVQVDADGTGAAHSFQDVVVLHNYQAHGNTVDIMFANAHQAILHVA